MPEKFLEEHMDKQDPHAALRGQLIEATTLNPNGSSNIEALQFFDEADGVAVPCLVVEFKGGALWSYTNVAAEAAHLVMHGESIGALFNSLVKRDPKVVATKLADKAFAG